MSEMAPLPGSQEVWDKRGQAELEKYGHDTEALARIAAGFSGDANTQALARNMMGMVKTLLPGDVHGGNLDEDYANTQAPGWAPKAFSVGNLDDMGNRMNVLDQMVQNSQNGGLGAEGRCASTVLLAAAMQSGGKAGLDNMIANLERNASDDESRRMIQGLKARASSGDMTGEDLSAINDELYYQLRLKQNDFFEKEGMKNLVPNDGIDPRILQQYIAEDPNMAKAFKEGKLSIDSVDTDGKGGSEASANHYVLSIGGENNNVVYDPMARKDGHQVVVNPVDVKNYHQKEWKPDRIDAADFGGTPFDGMY